MSGINRDRDNPPSQWPNLTGVVKLTDEIYYGPTEDPNEALPYFWHWCAPRGLWSCHHTGRHELVSREPLHLEPSLLWHCCGTHGFVRDGTWTSA